MGAGAPAAVGSAEHPRGLHTLFLTEMWERFSYYGMRALLVLFMVDAVRGGMGMTDKMATSIYGLYTAAVYLVALPGGWLADRLLGAQKAVWYGGILIALGHFTLAVPGTKTFYIGLILVVLGTGLLKPNISAIVGDLYPEGGGRRDAGFTIFYMGINLGAFIGPLVCSSLGERVNWHYGFAAAGLGMVLGLIQYRLTRKHLGQAGLLPGNQNPLSGKGRIGLAGAAGAVVLVAGLALSGGIVINPIAVARNTTTAIVGIAVCYFLHVLLFLKLELAEKKRVGVILVLFLSSALFWAGFEQAGSSFNLFADRYTERSIEFLDVIIPTGWFQALGPLFIIAFAPVMASLWIALARRHVEPSLAVKFAFGLFLLGAGFLVMAGAARIAASGHKAWPTWLIATYLLHTFGELCLSPVGLSSVTKLAPRRLVGQMMGVWFLATSLGNLIAGLLAGEVTGQAVEQMSGQYLRLVWMPMGAGMALLLLAGIITRMGRSRFN